MEFQIILVIQCWLTNIASGFLEEKGKRGKKTYELGASRFAVCQVSEIIIPAYRKERQEDGCKFKARKEDM